MAWRRLAWDWQTDRECRDLVADCEAFLGGRLAERLEDLGTRVPNWAWTNLLAHGSTAALRREVEGTQRLSQPQSRDWRRARGFLAAEVLANTGSMPSLGLLQANVLQPLEIRLAESPATRWWGPAQWAVHVSALLTAHRARRRRCDSTTRGGCTCP